MKDALNMLDFDDLEWRARHLLEQYPAVRARWQAEFQAVLVDEFQDTNDAQRAIIYALTGFADGHPPHAPRLFVVGDGKQSIYRFRGADVSVFQQVAADIVAQGGLPVALDTSFRTHARLIEWINNVSAMVFQRERALLPYEIPFEPLVAQRAAPAQPQCIELHLINETEDTEATRTLEAQQLAARLQALVAGEAGPIVYDRSTRTWRPPQYGEIALLCRASSAFAFYEEAFRAAGIPYLTTAGRGYYIRNEVQDLIHLLRVLSDPSDDLALVGVLRSPLFALDDATIVRLRLANRRSLWDALLDSAEADTVLQFARATLHELYQQRAHLTVPELLRAALNQTGYLATISALPNGVQRCANVEKLIEAARRTSTTSLGDFSAYLEELLNASPREGEAPLEAAGSVRLMTVHASKGLEFPVVVLPDLGRGSPPNRETWLAQRSYGFALRLRDERGERAPSTAYRLALHDEQQMEQAEHERLLYVALTRTIDYLILSGDETHRKNKTGSLRC
ncbi:MAG: UvrD-helicase domain-containing protein [Chloroflexaceae bacterium]|nr:UvrD-helicase domain-containing protein [Chloroflexaceae bacterium]